jgi:toluene monooxygenase system protein E
MLVAYDWGEAFTALNVCAKPALDAFLWQGLRELAREQGDEPLEATFASIAEDAAWHLAWSQALVAVAVDGNAANREVFGAWVAKWNGPVGAAVRALGMLAGPRGAAVAQAAVERANSWQRSIGAAAS